MELGARIWDPPQISQLGADDIITNLAKEKEAWDRDHRTHSLIFDYYQY